MSPATDFNNAAPQVVWPEAGLRAYVQWWADQMPGVEAATGRKPSPFTQKGKGSDVALTAEQYDVFKEALYQRLKKTPPHYKHAEIPELRLGSLDTLLLGALKKAGVETAAPLLKAMPRNVCIYLFQDGQIFVPAEKGMVPLAYEGSPQIPFKKLELANFDFTGAPTFRDESRYLVTPLVPGEAYATAEPTADGEERQYTEGKAVKGQVVVVPDFGARGLLKQLTSEEATDARKRPAIEWSYVASARDYDEGALNGTETIVGKTPDGIVRALGPVFSAVQVTEPFATGSGVLYKVARPGDWVTLNHDDGKFDIVPQKWRETGDRNWQTCDRNGTPTHSVTLSDTIKVGRALKLSRPQTHG